MERLLELEDIMLVPADINSGCKSSEYNFSVQDELDKSLSLPIFTSPMPSVISEKNWRVWSDNGIKPVIPRTTSLDLRLEACEYIFAAFSIKEAIENFITNIKRNINGFIRISIDCGNGHDSEIFKVGSELKRIYGPRVITMAGNIGSPKVYLHYGKALFDYIRVGMSSGSLVDIDRYGFHYPMASFLLDILAQNNTTMTGLKKPKVIVDGGIRSASDILKCIALGADYVMVGREFAHLIEADGEVFKRITEGSEKKYKEVSNPEQLLKASPETLRNLELYRLYSGNTTPDIRSQQDGYDNVHDWIKSKPLRYSDSRADWVRVNGNIKSWLDEIYDVFSYGFTMANAKNWKEFKNNIKPIRIR